jgi:hypothetical protein
MDEHHTTIPNEQEDDCDAKRADPDFRAHRWLYEPATVENTPAYTQRDICVPRNGTSKIQKELDRRKNA